MVVVGGRHKAVFNADNRTSNLVVGHGHAEIADGLNRTNGRGPVCEQSANDSHRDELLLPESLLVVVVSLQVGQLQADTVGSAEMNDVVDVAEIVPHNNHDEINREALRASRMLDSTTSSRSVPVIS